MDTTDLAILSDQELVRAYERTGGEADDSVASALLEEIDRRGIDL